MGKPILILTSVTYAIRAQKLLERRGIRAYIKRNVNGLSSHGCGYGVMVNGDAQVASQILALAGIRVKGIIET